MTRDELYAFAQSLATELAPPPPPPPPAFNYSGLELRARDVWARPGSRVARVPIELSAPAKQSMSVRVLTANGTVNENAYFIRVDRYVVFQPGEQFKVVEIPLTRDFAPTQNFKLNVIQPQNGAQSVIVKRGTALISGDPAIVDTFSIGQEKPLPARPTGMTMIFEEKFGPEWEATDSGYKADGITPCWRSRMSASGIASRTWQNLDVSHWFTDPALHLTTPWVRDGAGKLALQIEHFPDGVRNIDGTDIPCPTSIDASGHYRYSGSLVTTQRFPQTVTVGSYIEGRMTLPLVKGLWPAFWLIANDLSWPSIELDFFEGFFGVGTGLDRVGTTVHWEVNNAGRQFQCQLPHLAQLIPGFSLTQPHTWGCYWGAEQLTFYCDDVPYMAVPNVFPPKQCFLKINIGSGGIVGDPDPALLPAKMPLEFVRIWA